MTPPRKKDEWEEHTDSQQGKAAGDDENAFPGSATVISSPDVYLGRQPSTQGQPKPQAPIIPLASRDPRLAKLQSLQLGGGPSLNAGNDRAAERSSSPNERRKHWGFWGFLSAVLVSGTIIWVIQTVVRPKYIDPPPAQKPNLALLTIEKTTRVDTTITSAGYIAVADPFTIGSTVGARVKSVKVENGQTVQRGALLVQLDDSQIRAQVARAEVAYKEAKRSFQRYQNLFKNDAATGNQVEEARSRMNLAESEVAVLHPLLKAYKIVSPVDSTVTDVLVREGEVLTVGTAGATIGVVKLADLSRLVMEADVNESDISMVHRDDRAEITVDSFPDKKMNGTVRDLSLQADKSKGTVTVKIALPPDPKLRPGMSAKARFQGSAHPPERILVPKTAITAGQVWLVKDGAVHARSVRTQGASGDSLEVTDGLKVGDQIVASGGEGLFDGKSLH